MSANAVRITPEIVLEHGLKADEYERILALIGREPTFTELGIFSAMWNEHCSYKSSKVWLKTLPTTGAVVICGPGENAGVVDIGDGEAVIFKMESHNHPSYIEPYQGAGTGVGGILRDVFTMGARPVACLNALFFGAPENARTKHLVGGVVAGVGGYGNSFGVPTVGGSVAFDASYNGNILVNAMAVGIADTDKIFYAKATGVGNPIVYLGSKTGRDGIHGASMASAEFDDASEEKRPTVQVGDPFSEKLLLEACLELMASGSVIAIQDMGAAGLTCSAVEMGAKGDLGVHLVLDNVPCRESGMSAYEMMLSESQERMLMVLKPGMEDIAQAIFKKWDLDFAIIGQTTDTLRFVVEHKGEIMADLPIKELGDQAPEYNRPWVETPAREMFDGSGLKSRAIGHTLMAMLSTPQLCSRRWVWEQYDHLILGNTAQIPGGDAAVVRLHDGPKALAITCDVTPRYCFANPFEGGKQAVAECWRNLTAVGSKPLALTDNLNFGNPERPEIMGQFVGCVKGIGAAATHLNFPIVSGNVSLYNETNGKGILPTPTIGGVGLLDDVSTMMTIGFKQDGDVIVCLGQTHGWLGQSLYLDLVEGLREGSPPPVDLVLEKQTGDFVRDLILQGAINACHDVSDGGLAVVVAEMAMAGKKGAAFDAALMGVPFWFGEDQARYVVCVAPDQFDALVAKAKSAGIALQKMGNVEGDALQFGGETASKISEIVTEHESWLPEFMS